MNKPPDSYFPIAPGSTVRASAKTRELLRTLLSTGLALPTLTWVLFAITILLLSIDQLAAGLFAGMAMMTCGVLGGLVAVAFSLFAIAVCLSNYRRLDRRVWRRHMMAAVGIIALCLVTFWAVVNFSFSGWPPN